MQAIKQWVPAISGMVCLGFGAALMGIYGFFVEHLSAEFDVGVATINIGPIALLLVPGIVAPFVGRMVDRIPIRRILLTGITIAMSALFAVSQAPSLLLAGLGFLGFAFGLTLYGPVVVNGMLVKIYKGREARALAAAAVGISLASAILPPIVGAMLAQLDWRTTLAYLSLSLMLLLWLAVLTGIPANAGAAAIQEEAEAVDPGLYRSAQFWLIGLGIALGFNVLLVLAICYPPHFVAEGYSITDAGWFVSFAGISGLLGKAIVATVGDRLKQQAKWMAASLLLVQAVGLVALLNVESRAGMLGALLLMGSGSGGFLPMHAYLNSRYFGPALIGRVTGAQMPILLPFGMIAPPLAGLVFDRTGSYNLVMMGLIVALVLAAVLFIALPRPRQN